MSQNAKDDVVLSRAQIQKHYRKLASGEVRSPLRTVEIDGHVHLGSLAAEMAPGITLLCGVSGAGKSQFLRTLAQHLDTKADADGRPRPAAVRMMGRPRHRKQDRTGAATVEMELAEARVPCLYVDTARECFDVLAQVSRVPAHELESERATADKAPRSAWFENALSTIMERPYALATHQELDRRTPAVDESASWFYYELSYRGNTYGPEQMSLGELATCVILRGLRAAPRGSVVLFDEPENFLSPRARGLLLDVIVARAIDLELSVVIASHSPEFAYQLPTASLRTLERSAGGDPRATISPGVIPAQVGRKLGMRVRPEAVLLVEDLFARKLLEELLRVHLPDLAPHVRVQDVRGADVVVTIASALGPTRPAVAFLGVLDGDTRSIASRQGEWLAYLPGSAEPEATVMETLTECAEAAVREFGVPEWEWKRALEEAWVCNVHDQPGAVSEKTGVDEARLISFATRNARNLPSLREGLEDLIDRIRELFAAR
ncbi:AAA family ATPase [Streptomyces millisiae]|uniref:AAA family ATPase n=1 Tax=Streptomyces millisiae TaxID=3075542 RepID=A0ABU2LLG4_9ACTN|nr:AAA family ATPase [Streptomyces sp. DSM 44918]MDT0318429.1 AAA family ATPase [Streptomyces sp. DSM 44918]